MLKVIIDFDGTLTAEEDQAQLLAEASLTTLAEEILHVPRKQVAADYQATRRRLQQHPRQYQWRVNGLIASYGDEGAFILNTTTMQTMLKENTAYCQAVQAAFPNPEYDAVIDCTNELFHRHTAELPIQFRPAAQKVLAELVAHPQRTPIILTNSLGDKVARHLAALGFADEVAILGDTRQYEMAPDWPQSFAHPTLGDIQIWPVAEEYMIDLRRPAYHAALQKEASDGSQLAVVADTFSLPGAMPLMMGIPFVLTRTSYTPDWCLHAVAAHPQGIVLDDLGDLTAALDQLDSTQIGL
jgi:FMN phosphatase YigB (HAD superfamily)